MVGNLGIIRILRVRNVPAAAFLHDALHIRSHRRKIFQSADIFSDFFCHCRGEHTCIRSRIGGKLLLIQILRHLQRLIRTDLKTLGTLRLQLRKIEKQRRTLFLRPCLHGINERFLSL